MDDTTTWLLIFGVPGAASLTYGILMRVGVLKYWFIAKYIPGFFPAVLPYTTIPAGLGFIIIALAAFFPDPEANWNVSLIGGVVIFAGFVVGTFRPSFLKPRWLRWLESTYPSPTINFLIKEARKLGWWEWQKRVWTQQGLEQWIDEVLRKRESTP